MHKNSYEIMKRFVKRYLDPNKKLKILDVGSYDVNGSYKDLFNNPNWEYTGLDIEKGPNVDIVEKGLYNFGLDKESYDVIISGNCLEHVQAPWLWIKEIEKIIKKKGLICIIVPYNIAIHRFPLDCWRILPDGMKYLLEKHCNFKIIECSLNKLNENDDKIIVSHPSKDKKIIDVYCIVKKTRFGVEEKIKSSMEKMKEFVRNNFPKLYEILKRIKNG